MTSQKLYAKPVEAREIYFWLLDDANLQARILSSLIGNQFDVDCQIADLATIKNLYISAGEQHLVLVNCQKKTNDEIAGLLAAMQQYDESISVALLNVTPETVYEELIAWPQVMAMFYTESDERQLLKGLEVVLERGHWLPRHLISQLLETCRHAPRFPKQEFNITRREKQILHLLVKGLTNQEIGERIHVSEHTIRSHLYNVYKKIAVRNRTQACKWVEQNL